jgi:amino acid adenylation domain-containing protein
VVKKSVELLCRDADAGMLLSSLQVGVWFLYKLEPSSSAFNLTTVFEINGQFVIENARKAIDMVVSRHDLLRCTFKTGVNGPVVNIQKYTEIEYEMLSISENREPEGLWVEEVKKRSVKPFDLENGPILRILIIKTKEDHYLLTIITHQILSDEWSFGVFIKDFIHFYRFLSDGIPVLLPELPLCVAGRKKWQGEDAQIADSSIVSYWQNQLSGELPVLCLPTIGVRPSVLSFHGETIHFSMDSDLTCKLRELSRSEKTTLSNVLLAVYYVLLSRYTTQDDIVIGVPVANRNDTKIENVFGLFQNIVPIRIHCGTMKSVNELIAIINETIHDAFSHQDVPFNVLIEVLNVKRSPTHSPIFQTIFAFQNFPIESENLGSATVSPYFFDRGTAEYDLSLFMWENSARIECCVAYNTELFTQTFAEHFVNHFLNAVRFILENHNAPVNSINILDIVDKKRILESWNDTKTPFPAEMLIHQLFENVVEAVPDSVSVITNKRSFSYRELNNTANYFTKELQKHGVKPGELVGVFTKRHFGMIASMIGILKAGAAYVPLDPNYPQERILYMIHDAGIRLLITDKNCSAITTTLSCQLMLIMIEPDGCVPSEVVPFDICNKISPMSAAYLIYTSGSTGSPKGVKISHRSVVNFLTGMQNKPGLDKGAVVLANTMLSFDISVLEIFLPLITGAKCLLVEDEDTNDGMKLVKLITEKKVTFIQGTPSMWRLLIASGWSSSTGMKALCGGEPLPTDLMKDLFYRVKELWNMYGPTETTAWTTCHLVTNPQDTVLIGRPIQNTTAYILDEFMRPVPVGVHGELYIGGVGLAIGYHNLPMLTEERFLNNPFSTGRLYRTGDLVKYFDDGTIECLGRIDTQVKIRGFRIELGEVEHICSTHSGIQQCVAVSKEYSPGDHRLLLYFIPYSPGSITASELRKHLRSFLPEYMLPQYFIEMEKLPLTPAGKIDRKGLQLPVEIHAPVHCRNKEPETPSELYLARIWSDALGVKTIYVNDTFFNLGGHSLLSVQVISRIKAEKRIEIDVKSLMLNTLGEIAAKYDFSSIEFLNPKLKKADLISSKLMKFLKLYWT